MTYAVSIAMAAPWLPSRVAVAAAGDSYSAGLAVGDSSEEDNTTHMERPTGATLLHEEQFNHGDEEHKVVVNYQVPFGTQYVPIMTNERLAMVQIGALNG